MQQPGEKLLTVSVVAQRLSKRTRWVYSRINSGEIKAINIGTEVRPEYRIRESDYYDFLKGKTVV